MFAYMRVEVYKHDRGEFTFVTVSVESRVLLHADIYTFSNFKLILDLFIALRRSSATN